MAPKTATINNTSPARSTDTTSTTQSKTSRAGTKSTSTSTTSVQSKKAAHHDHDLFPQRKTLEPDEITYGLQAAYDAQRQGVRQGKRPFAAVLIGPDRTTVLLRQFSISHYQHAESEICRAAAAQFKPDFLWRSFLFTTWEPCAMCAGTMYWANIGTLVYGASEKTLQVMTGEDNAENFTMDLPCRDVLKKGQKDVTVVGPVKAMKSGNGVMVHWETKVCEAAWDGYWSEHRGLSGIKWQQQAKGKLT